MIFQRGGDTIEEGKCRRDEGILAGLGWCFCWRCEDQAVKEGRERVVPYSPNRRGSRAMRGEVVGHSRGLEGQYDWFRKESVSILQSSAPS